MLAAEASCRQAISRVGASYRASSKARKLSPGTQKAASIPLAASWSRTIWPPVRFCMRRTITGPVLAAGLAAHAARADQGAPGVGANHPVGGQAAGALEGDQGPAGAGAELAVHGHAQPVGGQPLLHGGHGVAALALLDGQHPAQAGRRPGRLAEQPGTPHGGDPDRRPPVGASTIRPEPRYMPTW